ncbi:MAG TPA: hypothetical protein VMU58_11550 [Gaiellaceae bacterium]|nr:hypothetical protein [Gaiellaceae bacterium]
MRHLSLLALVAPALAAPSAAFASGGDYAFDGGTHPERAQVTAALSVSSFPWNAVPGTVIVHIARGVASHAVPGQIWLDANLLDAGSFSWGVVQHEYGHEVDFALLTDATRAQLHPLLQGVAWFGREGHAVLDSERFADLVSWAYWTSPDNVMRPQGAQDEGGQVAPAAFRAALASILPVTASVGQDQPARRLAR